MSIKEILILVPQHLLITLYRTLRIITKIKIKFFFHRTNYLKEQLNVINIPIKLTFAEQDAYNIFNKMRRFR